MEDKEEPTRPNLMKRRESDWMYNFLPIKKHIPINGYQQAKERVPSWLL